MIFVQRQFSGYITKFGSLLLVTEDTRDQPDTVKWTCVCAAGPIAASNYTPASNCSESCGCTPGITLISYPRLFSSPGTLFSFMTSLTGF